LCTFFPFFPLPQFYQKPELSIYLSFNPNLVTGKTKQTKSLNEIPSFHLQVLQLLCDSPAAAVPCSVVEGFFFPFPLV
jgi:hypothetical protein